MPDCCCIDFHIDIDMNNPIRSIINILIIFLYLGTSPDLVHLGTPCFYGKNL